MIISATFFDAIAPLASGEKARVLDFLDRFQDNPKNPGLSLERLDGRRGFWSARASQDLRAILGKDRDVWIVLYVDHHDDAYRWAERRTCQRHTTTGVLEVVETVETVRTVEKIHEVEVQPPLFGAHSDDYLLSLGVPDTWLPAAREVRDDNTLWAFCDRLGDEVVERLMRLATGELVTPPDPWPAEQPAVLNVDARRRFIEVDDDGFRAALEAPLERWIAFLHPSQRAMVEGNYRGPVKVTGAAGTGKTVVALHRARHLARQGHRVLLTSFVTTLCRNNERNLGMLCRGGDLEKITVSTVHKQALRFTKEVDPKLRPANDDFIRKLFQEHLRHFQGFDASFVLAEWENVVQPNGIASWPEYRAVRRTGRGRALSVRERKTLWTVFDALLRDLEERHLLDWSRLCRRAHEALESGAVRSPYDAVLVDEVQDLKAWELRFLNALCPEPGRLMLVGDAGQRIYPGGFSLRQLGIETRGRSKILRVNYRTTEQIRRAADRLLGEDVDDLDGGSESRDETRSLLSGPPPALTGFQSQADENAHLVDVIRRALDDGRRPDAVGVFARTGKGVRIALQALRDAGIPHRDLKDTGAEKGVGVGTMHRAKGLEFKLVVVVGVGAGVVPSSGALRDVDDPLDREHVEARERRLLYVAMTRARDELHVTWIGEPSPFLDQLDQRDLFLEG